MAVAWEEHMSVLYRLQGMVWHALAPQRAPWEVSGTAPLPQTALVGRGPLREKSILEGCLVAQSVKCPTLDLGSGLNLRVMSSSPVLSSMLGMMPALKEKVQLTRILQLKKVL